MTGSGGRAEYQRGTETSSIYLARWAASWAPRVPLYPCVLLNDKRAATLHDLLQ